MCARRNSWRRIARVGGSGSHTGGVYVMPATQPSPGGAGELTVPAAATAVANAYARATGIKPRGFPIAF
jgi:CO/xanthine dehydrogenase Mo-binding subunit